MQVCAAVIQRTDRFLLATRHAGSHLAGLWEFPGGKRKPGETALVCIRRELDEELGLQVLAATRLNTVDHDYPEKRVRIEFLRCLIAEPILPQARQGQNWAWFTLNAMTTLALAPADRRFVDSGALPGEPVTPASAPGAASTAARCPDAAEAADAGPQTGG